MALGVPVSLWADGHNTHTHTHTKTMILSFFGDSRSRGFFSGVDKNNYFYETYMNKTYTQKPHHLSSQAYPPRTP